MSADPPLLKPTDTSDDEWKPGDEGLSLAEIHGVKRKAVRKCTARKTTKISPKQVQAAAKEHPEESPKFLLALKDQDTPISEREYSEMSRDCDTRMMLYLGFPYCFVSQSIGSWRKEDSMKSFLGCSCKSHSWFLTTKGVCDATTLGGNDCKGSNVFHFLMRCRTMFWVVRVSINTSSGVGRIVWRGKRPVEGEPGFLPRAGMYMEATLNDMYRNYFCRNYDRCAHENRCAEMLWFDGSETESSGSLESASDAGSSSIGAVSEVSVESSRPRRAASASPKSYTEEV